MLLCTHYVVPANAGTHIPKEEFGEGSSFGTQPTKTDKSRGMGPCVRSDDGGVRGYIT